MALTLRTQPQHDEAIARLAARYGVSRHDAVLRAVEFADDQALLDDTMAAYGRIATTHREALDRLGSN